MPSQDLQRRWKNINYAFRASWKRGKETRDSLNFTKPFVRKSKSKSVNSTTFPQTSTPSRPLSTGQSSQLTPVTPTLCQSSTSSQPLITDASSQLTPVRAHPLWATKELQGNSEDYSKELELDSLMKRERMNRLLKEKDQEILKKNVPCVMDQIVWANCSEDIEEHSERKNYLDLIMDDFSQLQDRNERSAIFQRVMAIAKKWAKRNQ